MEVKNQGNLSDWRGKDLPVQDITRMLSEGTHRKMVIMVGIPASGKSTFARHLQDLGFYRFCLDDIRAEFRGDQMDHGDHERVVSVFHSRLGQALAAGENVVVDNTNLKFEDRRQLLRLAARRRYRDISLVVLDARISECKDRNAARDKVVPHYVMSRMFDRLKENWPRRSEGRLLVLRPQKDADLYRVHRLRPAA